MHTPHVLVCALPTGFLMVSPLASINTPVVVSTSPVYFTLFHHSSILGLSLLVVLLSVQPPLVYHRSTQQRVFLLLVRSFSNLSILRSLHQGHTASVQSVAFSPDGRHIVSSSHDHTICMWDAQTGAQVGNPLQMHTSSALSVVFSPNGRYIVSGSYDHKIYIWDAQTGDQVGSPLHGHTSVVESVAFSPNGRHIVSGSWDHTICIWDAHIGAQVGNPLQGHTDSVKSVAFSPDGKHIVSGSEDQTICI